MIKNIGITFILTVIVVISSCDNTESQSGDIITIDVLKALKNEKKMLLSEIVENFEIIELEASRESYIGYPNSVQLGKKYIFVFSYEYKAMLFDTNGQFLHQIGKKGRGPGETQQVIAAAIDKNEEFVILGDIMAKNLKKYTADGKFIKEVSFDESTPAFIPRNIIFNDNNNFMVSFQNPGRPQNNYSKIMIYDLELNVVKRLFGVDSIQSGNFIVRKSPDFKRATDGFLFWERYTDTIYTFDENLEPKAKYNFDFNDQGPHDEDLRISRGNDSKVDRSLFMWGVDDIPGYLIGQGNRNKDKPMFIVYNKKSHEQFSIPFNNPCDTSTNNRPSFENDLYGIEPIYFRQYLLGKNLIITTYQEFPKRTIDLDCIREKDVKTPELRDKLMNRIEKFDGSENPLLILLHLKK